MRLSRKFNRCVKSVKKTVRARKGSNKESASIAICVKSVLHKRGRTIKSYARKRLITQKKFRGGMLGDKKSTVASIRGIPPPAVQFGDKLPPGVLAANKLAAEKAEKDIKEYNKANKPVEYDPYAPLIDIGLSRRSPGYMYHMGGRKLNRTRRGLPSRRSARLSCA